jgi:hypothetical protein
MLVLYIMILLHIVLCCTHTCYKKNTNDVQLVLNDNKLNLIISILIIVLLFSVSEIN